MSLILTILVIFYLHGIAAKYEYEKQRLIQENDFKQKKIDALMGRDSEQVMLVNTNKIKALNPCGDRVRFYET